MAVELVIDARLQALLPPLSAEEDKQLEQNLIEDERVTDTILYWHDGDKNLIVDGMNRYRHATNHKIPFPSQPMTFKDFDEVKSWVIRRCLGRRHLADKMAVRKLRGELYNLEKRKDGGHGYQGSHADSLADQVAEQGAVNGSVNGAANGAGNGAGNLPDVIQSAQPTSGFKMNLRSQDSSESLRNAAVRIAKEHGGSPSGVKRDAKLTKSLEQLIPQIKDKVISGDLKLSDRLIHALAKAGKTAQNEVARDVRTTGLKWEEACAQRGVIKAKSDTKQAPGRPRPAQGGSSAGREDKGQRTESLAPDFSPISEAKKLFDRMDKGQRLQVQRMWGEWIEAAEEAAAVTVEQPKKEPVEAPPAEPPTEEKVASKKNGKASETKTGARFVVPTVEEVQAYCDERKNDIDAEEFCAHYNANGWVQGNKSKPIRDWKSAVITWEKNRNKDAVTRARTIGDPRGTMAVAKSYLARKALAK